MTPLHRSLRQLFLICLVCSLTVPAAAQAPSSADPANRSTMTGMSRMRVVEMSSSKAELSYYTIVGEVAEAGVYSTVEKQLSIARLIEAAGGLSSNAGPSLRVIRNQETRFQLLSATTTAAGNELLRPGDVIVIPPGPNPGQPASEATIPIACLGLLERPVVLELSPTIQTLEQFVYQLWQSEDCARSAQVIPPAGRTKTSMLTSGSVIILDPRFVDGRLMERSVWPDPISIDQTRTSASPEMIPSSASLPPDVPAATLVQSASEDMIAPPLQSPVASMPQVFPAAIPKSTVTIERTSGNLELPALPPLPPAETGNLPVVLQQSPLPAQAKSPIPEVPSAGADTTESPALSTVDNLPEDVAQAIGLFSARSPAPSANMIETQSAEIPSQRLSRSEPAPSPVSPVENPRIARMERQTSSSDSESSPDLAGDSTQPARETSTRKSTRSSSSVTEYLLFCGAGICILLGISLLLSITFSPAKSTGVVVQTETSRISKPQEVASVPDASLPPVEAAPVQHAAVAEVRSTSPLQNLLNRSTPVIEEPVQIPSAWPLHGKAVGHRRLIVNQAHDGVSGPHFVKREQKASQERVSASSAAAMERHLRKSLRSVVRESWDASIHESILGEQVESNSIPSSLERPQSSQQPSALNPVASNPSAPPPIASKEDHRSPQLSERTSSAIDPAQLDIVLPPPPTQSSAMSPLERALRTLASEKRG